VALVRQIAFPRRHINVVKTAYLAFLGQHGLKLKPQQYAVKLNDNENEKTDEGRRKHPSWERGLHARTLVWPKAVR
jgi:hypothetical protein